MKLTRLTVALFLLSMFGCHRQSSLDNRPVKVSFGVSPFQDTLLPIIGDQKGWYAQEGLQVNFKILDWGEVIEALSAGSVDVIISNMSSVVATHARNPDIVYYYGLNLFDNGFALMIRRDGPLKPLSQISQSVSDHAAAVKATVAQLKGKTVITTSGTDMEQGVAAASRIGGLTFQKDIKIIDLNPDEGLAAFIRGDGDAYIGGIPQRTRAGQLGMVEMLTGTDLGPPPINGLVTTRRYAAQHPDVLLTLLHVWFQTVRYVDGNLDDGGGIIVKKLNSYSAANFSLQDFKRFWNNYEHYPATPMEASDLILNPGGKNYWKNRWDDCNLYFYSTKRSIPQPVSPEGTFLMPQVQSTYVAKYGDQ